MKSKFALAAAAVAIATPITAISPASAQYYGGQYQQDYGRGQYDARYGDRGYYDGRGSYDYRDDRRYRGRDNVYGVNCRRSSGTTGGVLGALGGGLIGSALGGGTLGTLLGAGGGALVGRELDRQNDARQNYRNGC